MSVLLDFTQIIKSIQLTLTEKLHDPIVDQFLSASPRLINIDDGVNNTNNKENATKNGDDLLFDKSASNDKGGNSKQSKTKIVIFEKQSEAGESSVKTEKEGFSKTEVLLVKKISNLSRIIGNINNDNDLQAVTPGVKLIPLTIFLVILEKGEPLKVRVLETCTVEQVIGIILNQYAAERDNLLLYKIPKPMYYD